LDELNRFCRYAHTPVQHIHIHTHNTHTYTHMRQSRLARRVSLLVSLSLWVSLSLSLFVSPSQSLSLPSAQPSRFTIPVKSNMPREKFCVLGLFFLSIRSLLTLRESSPPRERADQRIVSRSLLLLNRSLSKLTSAALRYHQQSAAP